MTIYRRTYFSGTDRVALEWSTDGLTRYGRDGEVLEVRPLTEEELAAYVAPLEEARTAQAAADGAAQADAQALIGFQAKVAQALEANTTFLALGSPTNAQVLAQVRRLTRQMNFALRWVGNRDLDPGDPTDPSVGTTGQAR